MAGNKNDAIELDALINPTLGDMSKVQNQMSSLLGQAAKPLVDSLRNVQVGLDQKALKRVNDQLGETARKYRDDLRKGLDALESANATQLRSAKGVKALAGKSGEVAKLVNILGGYEKTARLLSAGDGPKRMQGMIDALTKVGDASYQLSRLPSVSADTQKLLTKLYKSNSPEGFRKLSEVQQRQVREAMSIIDLQDKGYRSLVSSLQKGGFGADATKLDQALRERRYNAKRLGGVVSAASMERAQRNEQREREQIAKREARIQRQEARSAAVSEEKDRILKRTGGIKGLRDPQDIRAVRNGLNRDYNLAENKAAMARRQPGGMNSRGYKDAVKQLEGVRALRAELAGLEQSLKTAAKSAKLRTAAEQKADIDAWKARGMQDKKWRLLNEKADQDAWKSRGRLLSARNAAEQRADVEAWKERGRRARNQQQLEQRADVEEWKARGLQDRRWRLLNEKADQDAWKARGRLLSARNAAEQRADVEAWKERGRKARTQQQLEQRADVDEWKARGLQERRWRLLNEKADQDAWKARGRLLSARNAAEQRADVEAWKERGRRARTQQQLEQRADVEEWKQRGRRAQLQERLNQQADIAANSQRVSGARSGASYAEAQRLIQSAGGIGKMTNKLDMATVRSGLNTQLNQLVKDREVARAYGQNTATIQANIDALRSQRQALSDRTAQLAAEAKALSAANKGSQRNAQLARNNLQARDLLRQTGGDFSRLGKDQIATLRPYMQDRFNQRSRYAETIGQRYGANSPEFARASQSARDYANALAHLNQRSNELRPTISDLGQTVRAFFRYALGYGALYQMLGAVTALGRGLVDLDEQFYNIKAITLSTDAQMQSIEGAIKQIGLTTKFTLNEIAKGAQILAQAGATPEAIPQQLRAVADFAAATGSSLEQSADLLTSFKAVYSEVSDGKAADMLTKALNLSKLQGEDLRTIMSLSAQTAEGYNIGADQLLAAAATLRNTGIKPSTIATGLRQAMMEVFNPDAKLLKALKARYKEMGEDMSEAAISGLYNSFTFGDNPLSAVITELKRIGFGGEASNQFIRAFDIRAFNPLQALVNNSDQFNLLSSQVAVGQSAAEASQVQLESLRATVENLGAAIVSFSDSVGGDMVRSLQAAAKEATDLVTKLTELDIQMKVENGVGLSSTIGTGLAGGAIGALLAGKGVANRAAGFAVGSMAAGSAQYNSDTGDSSLSSQAIPAIAGLLLLAPALMDFIGGFAGKGDRVRTLLNGTKGAGKAVDGAIEAGTTLANTLSMFGNFSLKGLKSGAKGMSLGSIARVGVGLFARALPVIGILWTAYELLSLFGGEQANAAQQMQDRARIQANAQGDIFRKLQAEFDKDRARTEEWAIDDNGEAVKSNTTAATAVEMRKHANDLDASLTNLLGSASIELKRVDELLRSYAARDSDQRERDRAEIEQLTGKRLTDKQAYDLSAQMQKLDSNVEGYRQSLLQMLNRSMDDLQNAIKAGDAEGIEEASTMQRVLDAMPELREVIYGRATASAQRVTEMYIEFNKRMADETEKGTVSSQQVLDAKVAAGVASIASVALALDSSTAIENVTQQLIDNIRLTEKNTVTALGALSEKARKGAEDMAAEAARLEGEAAENGERAERLRRRGGSDASLGLADTYQRRATEAGTQAAELRKQEAAQRRAAELAEQARQREQVADDLAKGTAVKAANEVSTRFENALAKNLFTEDFLQTITANERALIEQMSDPAQRRKMSESGFFEPKQVATGKYVPGTGQKDVERLMRAATQYATAEEERSKQKALEDAKSAYLSDPKAIAEISRLQNAQKIAERRGDLPGAKAAASAATNIQIAEQEKAVERARVDMQAKKDNDKADATAATERYYSEVAKLQDLRFDLANKLDEYDKKIEDRDLKRRTVEAELNKRSTQKAFNEAVDRGDIDGAKKASQEYAKVQSELTELAKKELAAKGYSPEQIELEIRAREDLTTALIDQESAQKRLTSAVIARADFMMRDVGKGPTTGNKGADAYLKASGIGFTQHQVERAYARDLMASTAARASLTADYHKQRQGLTGTEEIRALDMAYVAKLEEIDATIGQTAASLQQLRNSFDDEILSSFNPTGLLVQLQNSNSALQNIGETVQGHVVTAFDNLGSSIGRAIVEAEDLGDAVEAILYQMSSGIFTDMFNTGVNYMGQQGLKMLTGDGGTGETEAGKAASLLGSLFGGDDAGITAANATVNAGTVMVNGAVMGAAGGGVPGIGDAAQALSSGTESMGWMDKIGGLFGSMTGGIQSAFSDLSKMFGGFFNSMGLFGRGGGDIGEGMKGGDWLKLGAQIGGSYFGGAYGFANGGQPSRVIEGKKSAKRDNLLAMANVGGKAVPIRVEADEGILSRKAMQAIGGEKGLALLNSGKMPGFSVGGKPASGYNPGQPATTGQEALSRSMESAAASAASAGGDQEVNIANIYSEQGFADFVTSRSGRKVIINELKKAGVI